MTETLTLETDALINAKLILAMNVQLTEIYVSLSVVTAEWLAMRIAMMQNSLFLLQEL